MEPNEQHDYDILAGIIALLKKIPREDQIRTLRSVATFLGMDFLESTERRKISHSTDIEKPSQQNITSPYSENRAISPKEFLREKSPRTDVERAACLAYYLTHYRDTPQFKTIDISTLNTEAARQISELALPAKSK